MTFYHLYTIAALIMAIMLLYRLLWPAPPHCLHDWQLVSDKEFPPKTTVLPKNWTVYQGNQTSEFCTRTYYAIMKCTKCGGLKEFRVDA